MISAIAAAAWALVVPYAGPVLAWFALRGWSLPAFATIGRAVRVASYVGALVVGGYVTAQVIAWRTGDLLTEKQAKEKAAAAIAKAEIDAVRKALEAREAHIAARERALEADALELAKLELELQSDRANSENGDRVVFSGADEWLRKWMARGR